MFLQTGRIEVPSQQKHGLNAHFRNNLLSVPLTHPLKVEFLARKDLPPSD